MDQGLPIQIQLSVVTPDREVVRETVIAVTVPGKNGYLGILPGHAPLLSELKPGELSYTRGEFTQYLAISRGFVEVLPERVIVLAETAEHAEEIDAARAQRAKLRAEGRLATIGDPNLELERAQNAYDRAGARLSAASRARK